MGPTEGRTRQPFGKRSVLGACTVPPGRLRWIADSERNFTWAGQVRAFYFFFSPRYKQTKPPASARTLGTTSGRGWTAGSRDSGDLNVTVVQCDTTANTCSIPIPTPCFALVFLTSDALSAVSPASTVTYPTSTHTRTANTIYIDLAVLETSYGHSGMENMR